MVEVFRNRRLRRDGPRPFGLEPLARHAVVQEIESDLRHRPPGVRHLQEARGRELADDRGFHLVELGQFGQRRRRFFRDHQRHALLRFGQEDFPRLQARILERHLLEPDFRAAGQRREFADGRRQAAGAVVGRALDPAAPAGDFEEIGEHLLRDGAADLHRAARRMLVEAQRGKRRAVDAVLARAPAGQHHEIARRDFLFPRRFAAVVVLQDAAGAAVDQRLARVARIEGDGAVDRRHARLVAALLDALPHAREDAARMELARQQRHDGIRQAEAQNVGVEEQRRAASARTERIAVVAQNARDGAAERIQRRRRIVRFHLEHEQPVPVHPHHARVVAEHLHQPVVAGRFQAPRDVFRAGADVGLEQRIDRFLAAGFPVHEMDQGVEFLVLAVLGPGLRHDFQFGVRRFRRQAGRAAARLDLRLAEMRLHRLHLRPIQREQALLRQRVQCFVGDLERDRFHDRRGGWFRFGHRPGEFRKRAVRELVHQRIAQLFFRQAPQRRVVQGVCEQPEIARKDFLRRRRERHAQQVVQRALGGQAFVVRRARQLADEDERGESRAAVRKTVDAHPLRHGVAQAFAGQAFQLGGIERRAHRVDGNVPEPAEAEAQMAFRPPPQRRAARIGQFRIPGAGDVVQGDHGAKGTPWMTMGPGAISPAVCAATPRAWRIDRVCETASDGTTSSMGLFMFHWR